jgi:polyphosphate kinase 2 (PPK2 family)
MAQKSEDKPAAPAGQPRVAHKGEPHVLRIEDLDLTKRTKTREYKAKLTKLQIELVQAQRRVIDRGHRVVLVFEGVDAAGKGGAVKRITMYLDPRGYDVHAIGAPNAQEQSHHYLRRFWVRLPSRGRIAIYDRSWYGRMLVEPVEGFCTKTEYDRAAQEIREFERVLADDGYCILKFYVYVDKDEQLRRFESRKSDPLKAWKLTKDDWRNREKFDKYVAYADALFAATDAPYAPWHLISGEDKNYARIKVLRIVTDAMAKLP